MTNDNNQSVVITVIGGGSVNWMKRLMRDVYQLDSAKGGEIRLVDPLVEHAEAVARMLRRYNELRGKNYEISVTNDRKVALTGSDFVLATFSPGRMDAFYNDLEIPIRYGIRQPVSMTVGPCGLSAALRTCPVAFDIVQEMEEVCPGAIMLNVTNPMTAVTRAMNMAARNVRIVGMCHEFHGLGVHIGEAIGLPVPDGMGVLDYLYGYLGEQGFDYDMAGINHFIWLTRASLKGRDMLPVIRDYARERLAKPGQPGREDIQEARRNFVKFTLCDVFGYMPIVGDRHLIEFIPSLCNERTGWGMEYGVKKTGIAERIRGKENSLREIEAIAAGTREVDWGKSDEEMTVVMDALLTGKTTVGIMNLPNRGQINNLPHDAIVETLADVRSDGSIVPRSTGDLPRPLATMCQNQLDIVEMVVEASLTGNRELFMQALALDPLSADSSLGQIGDLADELLYANRHWMSRFYDEGDPAFVTEKDMMFFQ
jgi:alpha-galactosidase/6-phospho-beta-glucosidase family protein